MPLIIQRTTIEAYACGKIRRGFNVDTFLYSIGVRQILKLLTTRPLRSFPSCSINLSFSVTSHQIIHWCWLDTISGSDGDLIAANSDTLFNTSFTPLEATLLSRLFQGCFPVAEWYMRWLRPRRVEKCCFFTTPTLTLGSIHSE